MRDSTEDQLKRSAQQVACAMTDLQSKARIFANDSTGINPERLAESAVAFTELIRRLHGRKPIK